MVYRAELYTVDEGEPICHLLFAVGSSLFVQYVCSSLLCDDRKSYRYVIKYVYRDIENYTK